MLLFFILVFGVVAAQTVPVDYTMLCSGKVTVEELEYSYYTFIANYNLAVAEWDKTQTEYDSFLSMRDNVLPSVASDYANYLLIRMDMRHEASDRVKVIYYYLGYLLVNTNVFFVF